MPQIGALSDGDAAMATESSDAPGEDLPGSLSRVPLALVDLDVHNSKVGAKDPPAVPASVPLASMDVDGENDAGGCEVAHK